MPGPMGAHCLFDQCRVMLARQTVSFGFFTHLCKQPAPLKFDEQIIYGGDGTVAKSIQFLVQQRAQLLRIQVGS